MDDATTRARLALGAVALSCLVVVPIVAAAAADGSTEPRATASASVKKKVKKLNKKFKKLQAQLEEISKQPGPQGPQGEKGEKGDQGDPGPQGPPGPSNGWALGGNAGTSPASHFLGTTDNTALELRVNDARALRLEPASDGTNQSPNVIGGIADNQVTAGVHSATIAGGGRTNPNSAASANRITDNGAVIGGGGNNQVGNGAGTLFDARFATVAGGDTNDALAIWATVGGGHLNEASAEGGTVAGGEGNAASGFRGTVGGGDTNSASGGQSTVGGGLNNVADGTLTTVGGGGNNTATGQEATVPGGHGNSAQGGLSLAAGTRAKANHTGAFVWADSANTDFASTTENQFSARTTGGARFVSAIDLAGNPAAGVTLASGGGSWASLSDEASKEGIAEVSGRDVLARLASIPISKWSYRSQGPEVRHIGPMAQDFHRAFGVGEDPRHITSIDAEGVALAAIQGLNEEVEALRSAGTAEGGGSRSPLSMAAVIALGAALLLAAGLGTAIAVRIQGSLKDRTAP